MKKTNLVTGIIFLIVGLLLAIGPQTIFHVCKSGGDMVMRCFYTGRAELAIGFQVAVLGLVLVFQKSKEGARALLIALASSSLIAFLVPNLLIGVCGGEMHCEVVARPAISFISIVSLLLSIVGILLTVREKNEEREKAYKYQEAGD